MSSPGQISNTSRRTSRAPSPASSYLSVPSSSAVPHPATGSSVSLSQVAKTSSGYVSPYPPLPTHNTSPTDPTAGAADVRAIPSTTQPWHSSGSTGAQEESKAAQKQALIDALNEHRLNTVSELRRVERAFASLGSPDLTQPMTAAWMHYVNSHSLLTEIRALTRHYPFSSECLDEAKRRVYQDPVSNRSWNLAWLVLAKVHTDKLIPVYARAQASRPEMWGGNQPTQENVEQLTAAFVREWSAALAQLLRFWETPPIKPVAHR